MHRFFAPSIAADNETITLPRDEGEHLTRVLRLTIGDTVAVFDGRGLEWLARVASIEGREVRVQLTSPIEPAAEPAVSLTLVQAVLKGEKMDDVVRDAVMLGVVAIQPIVTNRTETTVAALRTGARPERWRRIALAAVKQSRRAVLPEIRTPLNFEDYLDTPPPALRLMLIEPSVSMGGEPISSLAADPMPPDAAVLVGPEGGWTDSECAIARERGVRPVTLGQRTLRADATPVAAISVLQFLWGYL